MGCVRCLCSADPIDLDCRTTKNVQVLIQSYSLAHHSNTKKKKKKKKHKGANFFKPFPLILMAEIRHTLQGVARSTPESGSSPAGNLLKSAKGKSVQHVGFLHDVPGIGHVEMFWIDHKGRSVRAQNPY